GGNGVANSTVFGGIAGDAMATWVRSPGVLPEPDRTAIDAAIAACRAPLRRPAGDLEAVRERLYETMWNDVGIVRDGSGLRQGLAGLVDLDSTLDRSGIAGDSAFNLAWHDWLNLKNLVLVSQAIAVAALAREDSCGAHFRSDFPNEAR